MNWKKQTPNPTSTNQQEHDHLSLIKAAAWAWYQHGSGINHSKPETREIDVSRTRSTTPRRPTRYKLEALQSKPDPLARLSSSSSSLLLDLYEVERITRELDNLIGSGKKENGSKRVGKKVNGFRVICGSRSDVVEAAVLDGRRHRKTRMVS